MNSLDNTGNREIRIFLSSTFSDMQEERNYLTKKIFPRITEICEKRQIRFSVLDLRWGITEEESRTGKVIEICMDEIKRTKPYFIGLLGGRYGWIPTEEETVRNRHLTEKYPWIPEYMKAGCSITEIEMQFAALKETENIEAFFFLRDMDSVPARFREKEGSPEMEKLGQLRSKVLEQSSKGRCTADTYRDMSGLGRVVQERLLAMIDSRFPENEKPDSFDAILQRQAFRRAQLRTNYIDNGWKRSFGLEYAFKSASVIFVSGEKGIGKSALLANWHPEDEAVEGDGTKWHIIRTDVDDTVKDLVWLSETFKDQLKLIDPSLPDLDGETETSVPDFAGKCSENVVWIIDGLEKIVTESFGNFGFLFSMPQNAKVVIAGNTDFINRISGYAKVGSRTVHVKPLEENEIIRILKERLSEHGKSLTERQEVHVMSSVVLSNPSLLQLFIAELVQFGIHEQLDGFIDRLVNVSDREEFISRVLDIIEEDFGSDMTEKVLGLIACSKYGLDESLLTEELKFTPLEWSAIYGAIEPLVLRHDGIISIKEDYMFECISGRYVPDSGQGKKLRETAIRILEKEKKRQLHKFSVFDRFSYAIYGITLGGDDALRLDAVLYVLASQYFAIGDKRQAIRVVSHNAMAMMNSTRLGLDSYPLFYEALAAGMSPTRFFSFPKLLIYSWLDNDGLMVFSFASCFRQTDPDIPGRLLKKIGRMPLPKRYKENLCRILNNLKPQEVTGNMEDSWEPGKEINDLTRLIDFAYSIPSILSMTRVRHIKERAEAMVASLPEDSATRAGMKYIISFALVREGKPDEAEKLVFSSTGGVMDPDKAKYLRFEIAFARKDFDGCRKLLEDMKRLTATLSVERFIKSRKATDLSWELAIEEKTAHYRLEELVPDMARRLKELYDSFVMAGDYGIGYMRTIAYYLDAKKCFKAAAEAYKIVLEAEPDAENKAGDYANLAMCLDEDKRYAEAADAYMAAAGFYEGKDIIGYLDKIYSAAECYIAAKNGGKAAAVIENAFMEIRKSEAGLSSETKADCYNRIIVMLCNQTYDHFSSPERPLAIGCISMRSILECTAEPDIKVLSNFTYLLDRVSNLCPSPEKFREAFSMLQPHIDMLLCEKKEQFIDILPTLAIIAGDRDTAARLLDMVEEKKGKYAEQVVMLGMTSEDEEVRKNAISSVINTTGLYKADPEDIRKNFVNLLRKYNCLGPFMEQCRETADTDSLFTLWNMAAATSDEETMSWCEGMLKGLVAASRSADIPATFVAQRRKFSYKIEPKEVASLFRDWLGDASGELRNVIVFIDTMLKNCSGGSRNAVHSQTSYNSRRNEILSYLISALTRVADKAAFMEKIMDAVETMKFDTKTIVGDMITIADVLCNLCVHGNIPELKEKLEKLLGVIANIAADSKDDDVITDPHRQYDSRKTTNYYLADIYDLYDILGGHAPEEAVKIKLKCTAGKHDKTDNSFPEILVREIERGYTPDTEVYALATGYYISRNMTEEAEGCLELFAEDVQDDGKYALSLQLCRAIIDADKGEYAAASEEFSAAPAFNFGTAETAEGYRTFRILFSDFPELTDINLLRQLASISSIYAGNYSEGVERAGSISIENYHDDTRYMYTEGLLVSLAMIRSGQYEDALKYFQDKFRTPLEDFELLPEYEHLTLHLVKIEAAKLLVGRGDMEKASRMLLHARLMVNPATHPICRAELARAEAMLKESKERQESAEGL